jgi:hypothetical protein
MIRGYVILLFLLKKLNNNICLGIFCVNFVLFTGNLSLQQLRIIQKFY